jgi:exopolyphosphatase / guanosine-5'-triphosphate,3'-diphosphate pyrophosphatase
MIVASIDIGTNTVLLLISNVQPKTFVLTPVLNEYRMPRIGQGTKKSGIISEEKIKNLLSVLDEYKKIIDSFKCEKVILTGTNAFRMARNTASIEKLIKDLYGYELNVISGEKEAEFAYLGAMSGIEDHGLSTVIDIGGSSTEIIFGKGEKIISKYSLQIGSVVATENYLLHTPPLQSEINDLEIEIAKLISKVKLMEKPEKAIAIAGTATTTACMILGVKEFNESSVNNFVIKKQLLRRLLDDLIGLNSEKILAKYGKVMKGREDLILAGIIILYQLMKSFGIDDVTVSIRGIRYGAIIHYIKTNNI